MCFQQIFLSHFEATKPENPTITEISHTAFRGLKLNSMKVEFIKCEMNQLSVMNSGARDPVKNIQEIIFRYIEISDDIMISDFFIPLVGLERITIEHHHY